MANDFLQVPNRNIGLRSKYLALAAQKLSTTSCDIVWDQDFPIHNWTVVQTTANSGNMDSSSYASAGRLFTTTAASSDAFFRPFLDTSNAPLIANIKTSKWLVGFRWKLNAAAEAHQRYCLGVDDNTSVWGIGGEFDQSTATYRVGKFQINGGTAGTSTNYSNVTVVASATAPTNGTYVEGYVFSDTIANLKVSVGGEADVDTGIANGSLSTGKGTIRCAAFNTGGGTASDIAIDWIGVYVVRET